MYSCCIDKTSSAELSEAINSMYQWYQRAQVCYAYLDDTEARGDMADSAWFTRGWTLQELLAPKDLVFFNAQWQVIGTKKYMIEDLSNITGVEAQILRSGYVQHATIAERFSWAARRRTTRLEDGAYCLLGICDVNMPLLYGEGSKAFIRLQQEILRTSRDYSLLLWRSFNSLKIRIAEEFLEYANDRSTHLPLYGLLTMNFKNFSLPSNLFKILDWHTKTNMAVVGGGVEITLPIYKSNSYYFAALPYALASHPDHYLGIPLFRNKDGSYSRTGDLVLVEDSARLDCPKRQQITLVGKNSHVSVHYAQVAESLLVTEPTQTPLRRLGIDSVRIAMPKKRDSLSIELAAMTLKSYASLVETPWTSVMQIALKRPRAGDFAIIELECKQQLGGKAPISTNLAFTFGVNSDRAALLDDFYVQSIAIPDDGTAPTWPEEPREGLVSAVCVQCIDRYWESGVRGQLHLTAISACLSAFWANLIQEVIILKLRVHYEPEVDPAYCKTDYIDGEVPVASVRSAFEDFRRLEAERAR
jgi:hypothetical protein